MALAQLVDKGAVATPVSDDALSRTRPGCQIFGGGRRGYLEHPAQSRQGKGQRDRSPPDDFLQQLQASLRQDTSLTLPAAAPGDAGTARGHRRQ